MNKKRPCTAIVLSAGQGKRMGTRIQKQYIEIQGRPVIYYALAQFQKSDIIDNIILVVGKGQEEFCRSEIVEKYKLDKVNKIVEGGAERYFSVWNGLQEVDHDGFVFIHDGARPFVSSRIIERAYESVCRTGACVVGMPVKDTIKIADDDLFTKETPDRRYVWQIQTPQVFEADMVKEAYGKLMESEQDNITDDAMVVEKMLGKHSRLVYGTYENIKITTPEDLDIAELFLKRQ